LKIETRIIVSTLLRLVFLFFAAWVAVNPQALPGADAVVRIGLAAQFLVLAIFVGEVVTLRTQLSMLFHALRTASGATSGAAARRDDKAAVGILIRALDAKDEVTREKALRNLRRITGQDLPGERAAWEAWWSEHKDEFRERAHRDEE
jgi:hypothetical protein